MKNHLTRALLLTSLTAAVATPFHLNRGAASTSPAPHAYLFAEGEVRAFHLPPRPLGPTTVQNELRRAPTPRPSTLKLSAARHGHTATALDSGQVVVIGGEGRGGLVRTVEVIDTATKQVSPSATLESPRTRHTASQLQSGLLFVAGGWDGGTALDSTLFFDSLTQSFTPGPRLHRPRAAHASTVLPDGRILITGGRADASAEILDPGAQTLTLVRARMSAPRNFHAAAVLPDGTVLLAGGVDPDGQPLGTAETFDPHTMRFAPTRNAMTIRRVSPDLRVLPDGKIQIIGGDYDGTMEIYDPAINGFSSPAHLLPTADIFPGANVVGGRTRGAFLDAKIPDLPASTDTEKAKKQARITTDSAQQAMRPFTTILDRGDYSAASLTGRGETIVTGGVNRRGEPLNSVVLFADPAGTITTTKTEYLQGERPTIAGSGWRPHEAVEIVRQESRPGHKRLTVRAVADAGGNFVSADIPLDAYQEGVTYTLTARGAAGEVAQTVYKDAPPLDPALRRKPNRIKVSAPVLFRDASYEHEEGILIIRPVSGLEYPTKPPRRPPLEVAFEASHTFEFADIENKPCFGYPRNIGSVTIPCFLPAGLDVQLREGSFLTLSATLDADADVSLSKLEAEASVQFTERISGNLVFRVNVKGTFETPSIPIPGASVSFSVSVGSLEGSLSVGIVARLKLQVNEPGTTFTTGVNFSESVTLGIEASTSDGIDPIARVNYSRFTPSFTLNETNGGCLTLFLGPEIGASLTIDLLLCEVDVGATANISDFLEVCLNFSGPDSCKRFDVPVAAGVHSFVEGSVDYCVGDAGDRFDFELQRVPLGSITSGIHRDTQPPTFALKPDIVVPTAPNSCSAAVNYTLPTATDSCSGVKSITCDRPPGTVFQKGTTPVTCTATDNFNNQSRTTFRITVVDQQRPAITCPANIVKFTDPGSCSAVTNFQTPFSDNCPGATLVSSHRSGTPFPKGTTTVRNTVTDASGNTASCSFNVTVIDNERPTINNVSATPAQLWPPNHMMRDVFVAYTERDNCPLPNNACTLTVTSNEPVSGTGSGDIAPDWQILDAHRIRLRAERSGNGKGRTYTITITCRDAAGNVTVKTTTVRVPHSASGRIWSSATRAGGGGAAPRQLPRPAPHGAAGRAAMRWRSYFPSP